MVYDSLSVQEIGTSKLLIYKDDLSNLNFKLKLPNILTFVRTNFMDSPLCYFDITDKVALSELQRFSLSMEEVFKLLRISTSLIVSCNAQGIALENILFHPDYVFVDESCTPFFIPLAISGNTMREAKYFLKGIITNSIVNPIPQNGATQKILNCFNDNQFSFEKLADLISTMSINDIHSPQQPQQNTPYPFFTGNKEYTRKKKEEEDVELTAFLENQLAQQQMSGQNMNGQIQCMPQINANNHMQPNNFPVQNVPIVNNNPMNYPQQLVQQPQQIDIYQQSPIPPQQVVTNQNNVNTNQIPNIQNSTNQNSSEYNDQIQQPQSQSQQPSAMQQPQQITPTQSQNNDISHQQPKENGKPYLIYAEKPDAPIAITKLPFKVGRHPEMVDYIINSPYIGRNHAYIDLINGDYVLIDEKATNGTFHNGNRLKPEQTVVLHSGDMIQFAKYPFQFILR